MNFLRIEDEEKKNIISDIFGDYVNCKKGLIDSEFVEDFYDKLEILCDKWCSVEKRSEFFNYFYIYISNDMKVGMLFFVRKKNWFKR